MENIHKGDVCSIQISMKHLSRPFQFITLPTTWLTTYTTMLVQKKTKGMPIASRTESFNNILYEIYESV